MSEKYEWYIRPAEEEDIPLIYASWLNSYWDDPAINRVLTKTIFFREYPKVIDYILQDPDTQVTVACSKKDPKIIFGYIVAGSECLHYAYTKTPFQQWGILRSLIKHTAPTFTDELIVTHKTEILKKIIAKHPVITFNPFILYRQGVLLDGQTH